MSSVTRNPSNNNRHRVKNRRYDKKVFSKTADRSHWWNFADEVSRGGRRL